MAVVEHEAKTLLRKQKKVDSWFLSSYTMNLYRGCSHDCAYCDGRAEGYYVEGEFGNQIVAKINAPEILRRELDPARKRTPFENGYIFVGGGVGDSYQPAEAMRCITRRVLETVAETDFPVHLITKSALVLRDIDLLREMRKTRQVLVSFSFSSADDRISAVFEPGALPPAARFDAISMLKRAGIPCGMYLMPVIPFISDTPDRMRETLVKGKEAGIDFVCFGPMTVKEGRQKDHLFSVIERHFPFLIPSYDTVYTGDRWGNLSTEYCRYAEDVYAEASRGLGIPKRMPPRLFPEKMTDNEKVAVILEQLDQLTRARGFDSTYGWAARGVRSLSGPLTNSQRVIRSVSGVGPTTEKFIREILETGTCRYYEKMLRE